MGKGRRSILVVSGGGGFCRTVVGGGFVDVLTCGLAFGVKAQATSLFAKALGTSTQAGCDEIRRRRQLFCRIWELPLGS
jgi:hypothetical protein